MTELETRNPLQELADTYPGLRLMASRLAGQAELVSDNPLETQMRIIGSMLDSDDEESLFAAQDAGTIAAKDMPNTPFRLKADSISVKRSTIEGSGLPWYVLLQATDLRGENPFTINCGSPTVLAVLDKLMQWHEDGRDTFTKFDDEGGRPFQFVEKNTASGNTVLNLMPLETAAPKKRGQK